jgi:hypothetical protein
MKKYMFLYQGAWDPTSQEMKDAWTGWFAEIGDSIVDRRQPIR